MLNSAIVAEAIRNAQKITGKKQVTGEDVRRGFETLKITEARWKEMGFEGFAAPIKVTCDDHNGHHSAYMQQWDGTKWVKVSDWIAPMKDKVRPMLEAAAKEYVSKDPAWPKRSGALRQVELTHHSALSRVPSLRLRGEGGEDSRSGRGAMRHCVAEAPRSRSPRADLSPLSGAMAITES